MDNNEENQEAKTMAEVAEELTNKIILTLTPEEIDKLGIQFIHLYVSASLIMKQAKTHKDLAYVAEMKEIIMMHISHALDGKCFEIALDFKTKEEE